jgi:CheY-like chemotaxis protein
MPSVLVVDDSGVDRALAKGLLEREPEWTVACAENGQEAIARIKQAPPDIVVTDLQMPGMDGLELVTTVRASHSDVPVILMTAHGSELLALEALERGAAGYVPKSQLVDMLLPTVKQVTSLARADRSHKRLIQYLTTAELTYRLENDLALIHALVDDLQNLVGGIGLCDFSGRIRVGMALEQSLLNALYWGNLEITPDDIEDAREQLILGKKVDLVDQRRNQATYRDRRIMIRVSLSPDEARFTVRDEGRGFNVTKLTGPTDPRDLHEEGGRGLVLMRAFMDEVNYNDVGNEVTMIKRQDRGMDGVPPAEPND